MLLRKMSQTLGRMTWLRFGVRNRILRFLHNPNTCPIEQFSTPFFGMVYKGNFGSYIDWSVFYYGAYAREELRLFDDFLKEIESPVLLDVGANVGHHTLYASTKCQLVVSFEPFPEVANRISQKIADNQIANVLLCDFALGATNETLKYAKPQGRNTGTGSFTTQNTQSQTLDLPIRNGDEVLAELGVKNVHFIKIDTEGFEPFVLKGLNETLKRCRPLVFFEWAQEEKRLFNDFPAKLFPENYTFLHFISDTVVLKIFRRTSYRLETLSSQWPDGNLFAIPNEFIDRLLLNAPNSRAAKIIKSSNMNS